MAERVKITVRGIVQGVGFRPYVYTLADTLKLKGLVTNTADGVSIDIEGDNLSCFIERLPREAPRLSKIFEVTVESLPACGYTDFRIIESSDEGRFTLVLQDVSVCADCLRELFDPRDRRYLYPFINCTNCGPRFSITRSVPYDRPNTTMAAFTMCTACQAEYGDPRDRRFHAQPNACPRCGPGVRLRVTRGGQRATTGSNAIEEAVYILKSGGIVAVKGIGGFHLACDATNDGAVRLLRERKRKNNKPFAVMSPDMHTLREFCGVSGEEESLLLSMRRPIVLMRKKNGKDSFSLSEHVSPQNQYLGFMLPYTPLHYLLFYYPLHSKEEGIYGLKDNPNFSALVMTSGNISEEPIVRDNDEAETVLCSLADAFLSNDRDIFMRVDDSVMKVSHGTGTPREIFIRRSRGYTPEPIPLHDDGPEVLGCGADLKNTFTVTKGRYAIPSQHIGDMENYETLQFFEESLKNITSVYRVTPVVIAHDLHPNYLSTRWALGQNIKTFGVQHHYAHVGSVMAGHGLRGKVIGIAFDGTGYGTDGNLWGSEFLVADLNGFERVGHFSYVPLPGGERAIREPWRTGVSQIVHAAGEEAEAYIKSIGFTDKYGEAVIEQLLTLYHLREFSPLACGAGRLFDAVSSLLSVCDRNTFEGEAAIALESLTTEGIDEEYPYEVTSDNDGMVMDFSPAIIRLIEDVCKRTDKHVISTRFHNTVVGVIVDGAQRIAGTYGISDIVLTGGTFQNLYILDRAMRLLSRAGLDVFINERVPSNDAGISLGQAFICRERVKNGTL